MNLFLFFFVFFKFIRCFKIAMSITGMASRFQPHHLISFFEQNSDISFHLFYRFQDSNSLVYSFFNQYSYEPSIFSSYNKSTFEEKLFEAYRNLSNVHIESIQYTKPKSRSDWIKIIGDNLRVISATYSFQENVLNTYEKIDQSAQDILSFVKEQKLNFDYLIQTREDIYLFKNLKIRELISKYPSCNWIGKSCLAWGGLSQRFNIMTFDIGLKFLSSKINFFKSCSDEKKSVPNTEIFDLLYSKKVGMKTCLVPVDDVPATAARHMRNGSFCFTPGELRDCYPKDLSHIVEIQACK